MYEPRSRVRPSQAKTGVSAVSAGHSATTSRVAPNGLEPPNPLLVSPILTAVVGQSVDQNGKFPHGHAGSSSRRCRETSHWRTWRESNLQASDPREDYVNGSPL